MPLDTRIALGGQPSQIQFRDPIASYNQLAQLTSADTQNRLAQMQMQEHEQMAPYRAQEAQTRAATSKLTLDQAVEARDFIAKTMKAAEENSGGTAPKDPLAVIKAMLGHPNKQVQDVGTHMANAYQLLQDIESDQAYAAAKGGLAKAPAVANVAPAAAAAPAGQTFDTNAAMVQPGKAYADMRPGERIQFDINRLTNPELTKPQAVYQVDGQIAPFNDYVNANIANSAGAGERAAMAAMPNKLAPVAAVPTANVNAMVAPVAKTAADIKAEINNGDLQFGRSKRWAKERELLLDQYKEAIKTPVFHTVAEGAALIGPDGKPIYTAPAKTPTPSDVTRLITERNAAVARKAPPDEIADLNAAIKKATTPAQGTTVNVNAGQRAEDVEFGKYVVDQYKDVSNRAQLAAKSLPAIDINLRTLDKGFDTGFGTETKAAGASVLAALGVKDAAQYATDAQTFLANANSAVLQKQLEQKGPQTESDAQRINATGAQLGNTKEANRFILNVAKAQLQRDIDQRKFYSDWQAENKTFRGAEAAWAEGPGSASLFDTPALKKYIAPTSAAQTETRKAGLDKIFGGAR